VLAIREKVFGESHPAVAFSLDNLADVYRSQGKYGEAEGLFKRALAIREKALGENHPDVAGALNNLGDLYRHEGRYSEAEALLKRALAIRERAFGKDNPNVAATLNNLGDTYRYEGKYGEAEALLKRALAIREQAFGKDNPDTADTLNNLALVYSSLAKYGEAERFHKQVLAIREKAFGESHPAVSLSLDNLAGVYRSQGKYGEAEGLYKRALTIRENVLGKSHPDVAATLNNLATVYGAAGKIENALTFSRRATEAVIAHAAAEAPGPQIKANSGGLVEQRASFFRRHVSNLAVAARKGTERESALGREALEIAQWASHSSAAAALGQMSARFASGNGALATLVRESQDLSAAWRDKDKRLLDEFSKPEGQRDGTAIEVLRKDIADNEIRIAAVGSRLEKEFPEYAALTNPEPLKPAEVQKLLGASEALVFFLTGDKESYVFALSQETFVWQAIPLGAGRCLSPQSRCGCACAVGCHGQARVVRSWASSRIIRRFVRSGRWADQGQGTSHHRPDRAADCAAIPSPRNGAASGGDTEARRHRDLSQRPMAD
jgi:tetratricopeptide (TPR) repeat protein